MAEHDGPRPPGDDTFPAEGEWLDLPVPSIRPGFVDDTMARIQQDRAAQGTAGDAARGATGHTTGAAADGESLPRELLDSFAPSEPSAGFVTATLAVVQRDRAQSWRSLLLSYEAPQPTPDFVRRTLRALLGERPRRRRFAPALWTSLAAAAVLIVALAWPRTEAAPRQLQEAALAAVPRASAAAFSPTPMAALLWSATGAGGGALPAVTSDGFAMLGREGGR